MKKIVLIVFVSIVLVFCTHIAVVCAATKSELQNQSNDLQNKINQTKDEISDVQSELSDTMKQIQSLIAQIAEYQDEIDDLDSQISELEDSIAETEVKLNEAEAKYQKQEELLKERLVAMYEAGQTSYLDVLLSSEDIADFIAKYYMISEIAEYDTELLDQMEKNKNEIKAAKDSLEESKEQVETIKANKKATQDSLKASQATKQGYVNELSEDEQELKDELEQYEADKRAVQNELAAIAARESSNNGVVYSGGEPSSYGYIFPIPGLGKSNINNRNYPSYPGHTGVDININVVGKSVVAVKSGTVEISTALRNSNGTYRSYGEYVVINHHDGTMTLYAHMLSGSRTVSVGQEVSQGQVIGTVGSTGNSTGPHLHFEVRINGRAVNPLPYLP